MHIASLLTPKGCQLHVYYTVQAIDPIHVIYKLCTPVVCSVLCVLLCTGTLVCYCIGIHYREASSNGVSASNIITLSKQIVVCQNKQSTVLDVVIILKW